MERTTGADVASEHADEETAAARARALSSPMRWRILRACLDQALTNKELADLLGVNPGSMLHHVRTLVSTGFLAAEESRRGARNAIEIPYRTVELALAAAHNSTGFDDLLLGKGGVRQVQGESEAWRETVRVDDAGETELRERLDALLAEFRTRGEALPQDQARTISIVVSLRPLIG